MNYIEAHILYFVKLNTKEVLTMFLYKIMIFYGMEFLRNNKNNIYNKNLRIKNFFIKRLDFFNERCFNICKF